MSIKLGVERVVADPPGTEWGKQRCITQLHPGDDETGVHLTFAALTTPDDFHGPVLDYIVVTETFSVPTIPEPSTWAMNAARLRGAGVCRPPATVGAVLCSM